LKLIDDGSPTKKSVHSKINSRSVIESESIGKTSRDNLFEPKAGDASNEKTMIDVFQIFRDEFSMVAKRRPQRPCWIMQGKRRVQSERD
jgi:hypothetical protein